MVELDQSSLGLESRRFVLVVCLSQGLSTGLLRSIWELNW